MDFLALCKDLRLEAGISGTGPSAVTGQTGEYERVVNWIADAWLEIQLDAPKDFYWKFLWDRLQFATASNDTVFFSDYNPDQTQVDFYDKNSFTIYKQSEGESEERRLTFMEYLDWRELYGVGTSTPEYPSIVTRLPNGNLRLTPTPDDIYIIQADYYMQPQALTANSTVPRVRAKYHNVIVYKALTSYGYYEAAEETIARGEKEFDKLFKRMMHSELMTLEDHVVRAE